MRKWNVFIIEDDIQTAEINSQYIAQMERFQVGGIATTIAEAKKVLPVVNPDLILLDVYFPDGTGSEFLWEIRKHYRNTDVILVTAAKETEHISNAIRGGAFDYILKPIIFNRFQDTLLKYQQYKERMNDSQVENQHEVDTLFNRKKSTRNIQTVQQPPKGIDTITLESILKRIGTDHSRGYTAEEMAGEVGVTRTTARRYLEYLVSQKKIKVELTYGGVGRPQRKYFFQE
ncbi:response regulator [Rossellomorea aquimaris]|uniref:Two-component system CitB family response regulator n=1 Tax=Rossellomorea aquimaris TaxID=189382 RepID=A0A366EPE8_9BACI|nr:response regulator [Rossellomorea aquimaris]RBP03369.1 two-component system CitB family response regulator [Rossellomorea aquimaris]